MTPFTCRTVAADVRPAAEGYARAAPGTDNHRKYRLRPRRRAPSTASDTAVQLARWLTALHASDDGSHRRTAGR